MKFPGKIRLTLFPPYSDSLSACKHVVYNIQDGSGADDVYTEKMELTNMENFSRQAHDA